MLTFYLKECLVDIIHQSKMKFKSRNIGSRQELSELFGQLDNQASAGRQHYSFIFLFFCANSTLILIEYSHKFLYSWCWKITFKVCLETCKVSCMCYQRNSKGFNLYCNLEGKNIRKWKQFYTTYYNNLIVCSIFTLRFYLQISKLILLQTRFKGNDYSQRLFRVDNYCKSNKQQVKILIESNQKSELKQSKESAILFYQNLQNDSNSILK